MHQGGVVRWMSPELIDPDRFGFKESHRTKPSDCYALGMVIYEIISGHLPFHEFADLSVLVKVLNDEHPPRRVGFTDNVWKVLEQCWKPQPDARPSIEDVLRCLEMDSPSPGLDVEMEESGGGLDSSNNSCKVFSFHPIRGVSWSLFLCATSETLRPEL